MPPGIEENRGLVWVCSLLPEEPPISKPWCLGLLVKAGLSSSAPWVGRPEAYSTEAPTSNFLRVHGREGQAHKLTSFSPHPHLSGQMTVWQAAAQAKYQGLFISIPHGTHYPTGIFQQKYMTKIFLLESSPVPFTTVKTIIRG